MNWPERLRAETASGRENCALAARSRAQARRIAQTYGVPALAGELSLTREPSKCSESLSLSPPCRLKPGLHTLCQPWRSMVCFDGRNIKLLFLRGRFSRLALRGFAF